LGSSDFSGMVRKEKMRIGRDKDRKEIKARNGNSGFF
jgi:hypothetical protein